MGNNELLEYRRALRTFHDATCGIASPAAVKARDTGMAAPKKLGIDVHGVITETPEFLSSECRKLVQAGHEVHIMTGSREDATSIEWLGEVGFKRGINYTHFFSVTDHLIRTGVKVSFENGLPFADSFAWNTAKGEYAFLTGLSCLWDDSPVYGRYMPEGTWYFTYAWERFRAQVDQVVNGTRPKIGRT
jgi:hypothetical protein